MHNLGPEPREIRLHVKVAEDETNSLVNLLSDDHSDPDEQGQHRIVLEPYGYRWYRVGGLDYLLKRSDG
jgi:maltose alpha-D-glucosyltransferase/alpha-amylase